MRAPTFRRRLAAAGGATALVAALVGAFPADATASFTLTRVAGTDRFETASRLATDAFAGAASSAVIARGDAFADALAGSYLAGSIGGPILLTNTDTVPKTTKDTLTALGVKTVYVLGGTGAVSTAAENDLKTSGYAVTRIQGQDRYETGAAVATTPAASSVGTVGGQRTGFLVNGDNFADALSAGPLAAAGSLPILLTQTGSLPTATRNAITTLGIKRIVAVGGTAAVSEDVLNAATQAAGNGSTRDRVAGNDRFETATKVADYALANLTGWSTTLVDLATGENFADALAGGPAAGKSKRSILLTNTAQLSQFTSDWLNLKSATLTGGRVLGGPVAVSEATLAAANAAGRGAGLKATGPVVNVDAAGDKYSYVPDGASEKRDVSYLADDAYSVDGATASLGAFEQALSLADKVTHTPATATAKAKHDLVNVDPATITSGTIGNINTGGDVFDFVHDLSGEPLKRAVSYAPTGATYSVDGTAGKTIADLEAAISEGDTVAITGTAFALTNKTVTGAANAITKTTNPVAGNSITLKVGGFGDNPGAAASPVAALADSHYQANQGSQLSPTTDVFNVNGTPNAGYQAFSDALTDGDEITYGRIAGVQTFTLVDKAAPPVTGTVVSASNDGDGPPSPATTSDGGTITIRTATGDRVVTYKGTATKLVDGRVATEAELDAAITPGDSVTYQAGTGSAERVELTNA